MLAKRRTPKRPRRSPIPVLDVTAEAEAERQGIAAHATELFEKALDAVLKEGVDAELVGWLRAQHDEFQRGLVLQQRLTDMTRMMHAAYKLHGWSTLEQIQACITAAQAGDAESKRAMCEIVELVKRGKGGGGGS